MGAHVGRLGKSLDGAVKAYNETVGSLERQVLVQARRFEQHGITGIEQPELQPIQRQTRPLAAAELVDPAEHSARDRRCGQRRRLSGCATGTSGDVRAFSSSRPALRGYPFEMEMHL